MKANRAMFAMMVIAVDGYLATRLSAADDDETEAPLVTDRPDFTESTELVPKKRFQLEMGYTFIYDREGSTRVYQQTAPEGLLRIGASDDFELRLGWSGYVWTREQTPGERGRGTVDTWSDDAADVSFGFKLKFFEQEGLRPTFGLIAQATAPSGSSAETSGDVDPEVKLLWAYELTDRLGLAGNINLGTPTEDGHRFFQSSASISLAVAITDRLGAYVEYFGFYPSTHHTDAAHTINGGLTYLITNDFQIDARVGAGLNEEAEDFFTGVGFAWRF